MTEGEFLKDLEMRVGQAEAELALANARIAELEQEIKALPARLANDVSRRRVPSF